MMTPGTDTPYVGAAPRTPPLMTPPQQTPRGLRAAQWYIAHWHTRVVPMRPGTRWTCIGPTGVGHQRASDDLDQLDRWWQRFPDADCALLTTDRLLILDADRKHGVDGCDTLHDLEQRYGPLPDAPTVTTPHHGEHRYFQAPGGIRNSVAKLGAGVDIRGDNSLVFPPPCRGYAYLIGYSAADLPLPELPPLWVAAIRHLDELRGEHGDPFRLPDTIGKGERNDTLFRYAASMRARKVEWKLLCASVHTANTERCDKPLGKREVNAILASVESYDAGSGQRTHTPYPARTAGTVRRMTAQDAPR
ncbi:bifunctional DNA primase/polymerase [bacterium]|nr:bifunctional DNA primase/polymerase [bacterium]